MGDTLAAVLRGEPDWAALPATVPAAIRTLMQRLPCEGSTSARRRHRGRAVRPRRPCECRTRHGRARQRRDDRATTSAVAPPRDADGRGHRGWRRRWHGRLARDAPDRGRTSRVSLSRQRVRRRCPWTLSRRDLAITPDGTHIVYIGAGTTGAQLFVRALDQLEPTPLVGLGSPRARSSRRMDNGSASSTLVLPRHAQEGGHHRRTGPPPLSRSTVQAGAPPGVATAASSLRRPRRQQASSACRRPAASRRS